MFIKVSEKNIQEAAEIHSLSWKDSHKALRKEIKFGKEVYMLTENY